jgi:lysine 2,3-aminomutase
MKKSSGLPAKRISAATGLLSFPADTTREASVSELTPSGATLRSPHALAEAGLVPSARLGELEAVARRYAVAVTPLIARLIDPADPDDPIARQFIPSRAELDRHPEEREDPIGDHAHMPVKGIVHRYPDRVLLKPTHACPVYCRFCFRREMVGPGGDALNAAELEAAYAYIAGHPDIFEVIITGGDPLILSPRRLGEMVRALSAIPHLGVIRLHSRVPIVDPDRIDRGLLAALETPKGLFLVLHANHPRELTDAAAGALRRLNRAGVALLSQTVLLNGVNDDSATLEALLRRLVSLRVKPYHLHHGDLAPGTVQFRTTIETGQALMAALWGRVSGLCQPLYVLDLPGGHGKVPIGAAYLAPAEMPGEWLVTDYRGVTHRYPPLADCPSLTDC